MLNEPYADPSGGGVIGHFYRELGEIGWNTDLASIQARSQCTARLRDTIWPGWQEFERQIHELFGGRYMFFPLTPVGLDGLGEMGNRTVTISRVGTFRPAPLVASHERLPGMRKISQPNRDASMSWPLASDFNTVLQNPAFAFADAELKKVEIEKDANRQPRARSGAFANVYKAIYPNGKAPVAVRVFTSAFTGKARSLSGYCRSSRESTTRMPGKFHLSRRRGPLNGWQAIR